MSNTDSQQLARRDALVAAALADVRYGAVEIPLHDGRTVAIEKREKLRPATPPGAPRDSRAG